MKRFVGVGACYLDTILSVPHFITEDEKLRASSVVRRRGGNAPNTIEVLQQLLDGEIGQIWPIKIHLLAVFPDRFSAATQELQQSLGQNVSTTSCLYRDGHVEPASSYIIRNLETGSRTIINYNALPEMTSDEFIQVADSLGEEASWYHFEGRIPDVTIECIRHIRKTCPGSRISLEVEKPAREGLQELVPEVDVVFFSKSWALGNGYQNPVDCLQAQAKMAPNALFLCCTWGESGASVLEPATRSFQQIPAYKVMDAPVVDTIGAGDTFIAGMLYSCLTHFDDWPLLRKLEFANEVAGRKVVQDGFSGLAWQMHQPFG